MNKPDANLYQSNGTPPITATLERFEDLPEGRVAHLATDGGVKIQLPMAEFEKNWKAACLHYYRYFVSYQSATGYGRCGVSRQKPIESITDINEMERYLTEENMKSGKCETPEAAAVTITGWQPFELPPGIGERAAIAASILGFILEQDKAGVSWWTPVLQAAIEEVLA